MDEVTELTLTCVREFLSKQVSVKVLLLHLFIKYINIYI